jgi:hypothetical protein
MSKRIYRVVHMYISQQQANGIWVYRRRIPTDMVEAFKRHTGKKSDFYKKSLGTRNKQEANALAVTIDNEFQVLLRKLKSHGHILPQDIQRVHLLLRLHGIISKRSTELDAALIEQLMVKANEDIALIQAKVAVSKNVDELVQPKYWGLKNQKEVPLGNYLRNMQNIIRVLNVGQRMFTDPTCDVSTELAESLLSLKKARLGIDTAQSDTSAPSYV